MLRLVSIIFFLLLYLDTLSSLGRSLEHVHERINYLETLASILNRPSERLKLLDQRRLTFSFISGKYESFVIRDILTNETIEIAIDTENHQQVDPNQLQQMNAERAPEIGKKLDLQLRDLLVRHSDLEEVQVHLHFTSERVKNLSQSPPQDWVDPEFRRKFQEMLNADIKNLGLDLSLEVPSNLPLMEVTLAGYEIIQLSRSQLIDLISLVSDPVILD